VKCLSNLAVKNHHQDLEWATEPARSGDQPAFAHTLRSISRGFWWTALFPISGQKILTTAGHGIQQYSDKLHVKMRLS